MRVVLAPCKMLRPEMLSWVKQWGLLFADEIIAVLFIVFMTVATGTGESQIFQSCSSAMYDRNDMFHRKGIGGDIQRTKAVFTAPGGTLFDSLPQTLCDSISQWEEPANRVVS